VRVAIADDSALFREGLRLMLTAAGIDVTVQARTGTELLARIYRDPPDVAMLDIRMPPTFTDEGLVAAQQLRAAHPAIGVLVLSTYAEISYAVKLLSEGQAGLGYLLKDRVDDVSTLCDALERVARQETVIDPDIVRRLFARRRATNTLQKLTQRERQVLQLMAEGRSNAGIARQLHLGTKVVEAHIAAIFRRLDLHGSSDDNRRVLAVLSWLRNNGHS
jgi:DNA-binding NarL/FixJ family response regulator